MALGMASKCKSWTSLFDKFSALCYSQIASSVNIRCFQNVKHLSICCKIQGLPQPHCSSLSKAPGALSQVNQSRSYCDEAPEQDRNANEPTRINLKAYKPVDVAKSIQYLESEAYKTTYGDDPIWYHYRPNHKFSRPRRKTRKTCVRGGQISTGNPCPICRDDHLVFDYKNVKLLKQFMSPNEMTIYAPARTQICLKQDKQLRVALERARLIGLLEYKDLEFRTYDYSQYYDSVSKKKRSKTDEDRRDQSFVYKILQRDAKA